MKRAEKLDFRGGRLPAHWYGICSDTACTNNANFTIDGTLYCKRHASAAALSILLNEESSR